MDPRIQFTIQSASITGSIDPRLLLYLSDLSIVRVDRSASALSIVRVYTNASLAIASASVLCIRGSVSPLLVSRLIRRRAFALYRFVVISLVDFVDVVVNVFLIESQN